MVTLKHHGPLYNVTQKPSNYSLHERFIYCGILAKITQDGMCSGVDCIVMVGALAVDYRMECALGLIGIL